MSGLTLLHPGMLLLLLLPPLAWWFARRRRPPALALPPLSLAPDLPRTWRSRLAPLPAVLQGAALVLGAVALARPVRAVPEPERAEGLDVLLCLDLSSSMTAKDLEAGRTRLEVARDAAVRFVRGRAGDRVGLVGFARYPELLCPPTPDLAALEGILRAVEPVEPDGPEDATGIGAAAARAAESLAAVGGKSRVAILLTDGEENVATAGNADAIAPSHAAQLCRELGVRVYAVVAGGPADAGRAAPDTGPVRRLAERTGGRFFEARDAGALDAVYA
ncbi:MAG TPA: VWA domain-containing protein, partial [Planctomycetota bacterium]|nr:VWA domain-containing protein [Planctomycetota bacterium]